MAPCRVLSGCINDKHVFSYLNEAITANTHSTHTVQCHFDVHSGEINCDKIQ